ncbi:hypothetical protein QP810_09960 [Streptococcus agalactiae]|uniref:hypothetical protein n=1 Tax=Streptococcus agalactiae TaxID=1311 RepID=UPI002554BBEE|nr:hypothetical protein [Streptococcus agalactiae]MDK8747548.1 hypothetical protein [Streptococcus agalactiae]
MENISQIYSDKKYSKKELEELANLAGKLARGEISPSELMGINVDQYSAVAFASKFINSSTSNKMNRNNLSAEEMQMAENLANIVNKQRGLAPITKRNAEINDDFTSSLSRSLNSEFAYNSTSNKMNRNNLSAEEMQMAENLANIINKQRG